MGDASDGLSVTDGQDRGETGPGGSDRGAREKEREREMGLQWDTGMWDRATQCRAACFKLDLKQKSGLKWFKTFSNLFKLWSIRKVPSLAQKIEINIVLKLSKRGTTFSI
jgi:hypothetical protein